MAKPFKCPSCGGPLEYDGGDITIRCQFCSSNVIIPEELREMYDHAPRGSALPWTQQIANLAEMARMLRAGNKIDAIKLYRETFGTSLKDAKEAIEKLAGGHSVEVSSAAESPYHYEPPPPQLYGTMGQGSGARRAGGCSPFVVALLVFVTIIFGIGIAAYSFFGGFRREVTRIVTGNKEGPGSGDVDVSSPTGFARVLLKFGSEGIGPGQFKDARTVAVDGEGRIYAADYIGGRVQVFDAKGKFLTQWMVDAKMPLLKLAADRKGVVYIVQRGDITRYDGMTGKVLGKVTPISNRGFDDVIVTPDGGLVAVNDSEDLIRYDASGAVVSKIEDAVSGQSGDSELDAKVAVDGLGNLYAMGRFNDAVFKFGPNGKFLTRIGGTGDEPGLFRALNAIAVDGQGRIYVSDIKGVQVFDANGRYLDVFKIERGVPFGLLFNDQNELFVAARTQIIKFGVNK